MRKQKYYYFTIYQKNDNIYSECFKTYKEALEHAKRDLSYLDQKQKKESALFIIKDELSNKDQILRGINAFPLFEGDMDVKRVLLDFPYRR